MIDELDSLGRMQSKCMKCDAKYIAESSHGTGNMLRHIRSCKGKVYRDIGQMILQSNASGAVENRPSTFKFDEFREILALAIARHNLPLQFVEYEGIRAVFSYLCPEVKHVSRRTIKNDIMKIHTKEKIKLDELLKRAPSRIAITSDCWSSITTDGYISLTAHFIEKKLAFGKKGFSLFFYSPSTYGCRIG
ncbi:putative AC9 transposase [Bienertia sinuspersici]